MTVETQEEKFQGWLVSRSARDLVLSNEQGRLIHVNPSKVIRIKRELSASSFPYPDQLSFLRSLHSTQMAYVRFDSASLWGEIKEMLLLEIALFRDLPKETQREYLVEIGNEIIEKVKRKYHSENIGFHYNLNGGNEESYVNNGGIRISKGDIQLAYGHGDWNEKIYFFQSKSFSLYEILDQPNPKWLGKFGRMGSVLIAFRLDGEYLKKAREEKGILDESAISLSFSEEWVNQQLIHSITRGERIGILASEYLGLPARVFDGMKSKLGLRVLSRNEETLATMRYLEAIWGVF